MEQKTNYPDWLKIKHCHKVQTKDVTGKNNGILVDILNRNDEIMKYRLDEPFQQYYMSTVLKGMFKGYHTHPHKLDTLHCVYGKFCLVLYPEVVTKDEAEDTVINTDKLIFIELGEDSPVTVTFPSKYPHGFFGITDTAVIINYRNPAWNPKDTYQFDIECEKTVKILNDKYYKARI
jgi:dTDP-4-dehydrorhamnose 3,5-epimerase-like enzyme